jgi:hypothetical protein
MARSQSENLCRYVAQPAVATERLSIFPGGRVLYRLRHGWRDGNEHVIFDPFDLIGKLAVLVPPPQFNMVKYHDGLFELKSAGKKLARPGDALCRQL